MFYVVIGNYSNAFIYLTYTETQTSTHSKTQAQKPKDLEIAYILLFPGESLMF